MLINVSQPEYIGNLFYYSMFYNKTLKIKINPSFPMQGTS